MNQRQSNKLTFHQVLAETSQSNLTAIMRRARAANQLAKITGGKARVRSYQVKVNALIALTKRFPNEVAIQNDFHLPRMIVVTVPHAHFGLHAPIEQFISREASR